MVFLYRRASDSNLQLLLLLFLTCGVIFLILLSVLLPFKILKEETNTAEEIVKTEFYDTDIEVLEVEKLSKSITAIYLLEITSDTSTKGHVLYMDSTSGDIVSKEEVETIELLNIIHD